MDPSSLQWSLSNAGQAGYILLNCAVFWVLISEIYPLQIRGNLAVSELDHSPHEKL